MSFPRFFVLGGLLALFTPVASPAQDAKPPASYTDAEAAKHAGEEATVTGTVTSVTKSVKGVAFLNFGGRYPNHTFTGVVFASDAAAVGDLKPFEGKAVAVTGRIALAPTDRKPQIVITKAEQLKLAAPSDVPAPTPPPPEPAPSTPAKPAPMTPATPAPANPAPAPAAKKIPTPRKITLSTNWNRPVQGGEMTRKDLALLFGAAGSASENVEVDASMMVYPDIPMLAPLAEARKTLRLENTAPTVSKITCAGLPADSLTAHSFSGVFAGGFTRLQLITDQADQVVSVLLVDENTRQRAGDLTDSFGYHAYNFINNRVKANNELVVKHEIAKTGAPPGVVLVDSLLIDGNDPEDLPATRTTTRTTKSKPRKPTTGRVMERSRWFVPQPMVNLILRCVGSR